MKVEKKLDKILYPKASTLILGSYPGVKSLEDQKYYAHPQNQFWKIISAIYGESVPLEYEAKRELLKRNQLALWDVIEICDRRGSSDSSITNVHPNKIPELIKSIPSIKRILLNGKTAEKYFHEHFGKHIKIPACYVPSSSPAHAGMTLQEKIALWKKALLADV